MAEEKKKDSAKPGAAERKPARRKPAAKAAGRKPASAEAGAKKETPKKETPKKEAPKPRAASKEAAKPKAEPRRKPAAKQAEPVPVIVRASARYVRVAPRKARLVADQVRGLEIDRARALLQFSPRGAARDIQKLLDSAAANAENNHDLVADEMRISEINVDEGPTLRRYRPRALGRATRINKRTSHISIALTPED
jgi:large subunit ribosomal protein L22